MANLDAPSVPSAVTSADFASSVLAASQERLVLVDVWASWCGPCKALAPILEQVARSEGSHLKIVKVDADEEPELAAQLNVRALPTLLFFRGGEVVDRMVGLQSAAAIQARAADLQPAVR